MSVKHFNLAWKYFVMLVVLLLLAIQPHALGAEENRIWLKESEMQYSLDGSAFSEFTLMNKQEPLKFNSDHILAAQCLLKERNNSRGVLFALKPIITNEGIKFKISSPYNSGGSLIVKLKQEDGIYVAQRQFRLYGNSYTKKSLKEDILSMDKLVKPSFILNNSTNLQKGRPITIKYSSEQGINQEDGSLRAYVYNNKGRKEFSPTINQIQEFTFTIPREPALSVHPSYKADAYTLFVDDNREGESLHASVTMNVYSTRYEYTNIKHGVYVFIIFGVLTVVLFTYLLGRNKHVY